MAKNVNKISRREAKKSKFPRLRAKTLRAQAKRATFAANTGAKRVHRGDFAAKSKRNQAKGARTRGESPRNEAVIAAKVRKIANIRPRNRRERRRRGERLNRYLVEFTKPTTTLRERRGNMAGSPMGGLNSSPMERSIRKILIANRGEIALRIIRTCRRLGIAVVVVHSTADAHTPAVKAADETVEIGPPEAASSYLNIEKIVQACRDTGADAVHPGYGFLAENEGFAKALDEAGIIFIGPRPEVIRGMGDKIAARQLMQAGNVQVVPGYDGDDQSPETLKAEAKRRATNTSNRPRTVARVSASASMRRCVKAVSASCASSGTETNRSDRSTPGNSTSR